MSRKRSRSSMAEQGTVDAQDVGSVPTVTATFNDDNEAMIFLQARGYKQFRGVIYPADELHVVTEDEMTAMAYLIDEWDYAWDRHLVRKVWD